MCKIGQITKTDGQNIILFSPTNFLKRQNQNVQTLFNGRIISFRRIFDFIEIWSRGHDLHGGYTWYDLCKIGQIIKTDGRKNILYSPTTFFKRQNQNVQTFYLRAKSSVLGIFLILSKYGLRFMAYIGGIPDMVCVKLDNSQKLLYFSRRQISSNSIIRMFRHSIWWHNHQF